MFPSTDSPKNAVDMFPRTDTLKWHSFYPLKPCGDYSIDVKSEELNGIEKSWNKKVGLMVLSKKSIIVTLFSYR